MQTVQSLEFAVDRWVQQDHLSSDSHRAYLIVLKELFLASLSIRVVS